MTSHCDCNCLSPFRWAEHPRPSIFTEKAFTGSATSGKTMSQISSEGAEAFLARTGRSLGSIAGISYAGDASIEESNNRRARKVAR